MSLVATERETYETVWAVPDYGKNSPGQMFVSQFLSMAGVDAPWRYTVLDAGCGSGKGAVTLAQAGFTLTLCDLTDAGLVDEAKAFPFRQACLWQKLRPQLPYSFGGKYDYVYCCDVLEHVPTPFTMLTIARLLEVTRRGLFLSIALDPDVFGVWVGKHLHQTVQSFVAWRDQLSELGTVKEARDLLTNGLYLVEPK